MASTREQILAALFARLELVKNTVTDLDVLRNEDVPVKVPAGGVIVMEDGDPGEPEVILGGAPIYQWQHEVLVIVAVQKGADAARTTALDDLLVEIETAIAGDRTLGGLADDVRAEAVVQPDDEAPEGATTVRGVALPITVTYDSPSPLT